MFIEFLKIMGWRTGKCSTSSCNHKVLHCVKCNEKETTLVFSLQNAGNMISETSDFKIYVTLLSLKSLYPK